MVKQEFLIGLSKIQEVFQARYHKAMEEAIWDYCCKWRVETWEQTVSALIVQFKPNFNCSLPVVADVKEAYDTIPAKSDYVKREKEPTTQDDLNGMNEYRRIVKELMKKWGTSSRFKLTSPYIDGIFACEICHRNGCNGGTPERLKNGCPGYLSEEKAKEIAELIKYEAA